jgi:hypothetical protein
VPAALDEAGRFDARRAEGPSTDERAELVRLRRETRVQAMEIEILKRASAYFARENVPPKIGFRLVRELAAGGISVAVACRVLRISRSDFYEWSGRPLSVRAVADAALTTTITEIHGAARATYGAPRVHAELRLGLGVACGRRRVARPMRAARLQGICHRRKHRRAGPLPAPHADLVQVLRSCDARARPGLDLYLFGRRCPDDRDIEQAEVRRRPAAGRGRQSGA